MADCGDVKKVFIPNSTAESDDNPSPVRTSGISIHPYAAEKIVKFVGNDGKSPDEWGLRVIVKKSGCSGFSYDLSMAEIADCKSQGDKIFTQDGAHLMVEKTSYLFIIGSELTYSEGLTGAGFSLTNPNIKKTCSCGSSFAV